MPPCRCVRIVPTESRRGQAQRRASNPSVKAAFEEVARGWLAIGTPYRLLCALLYFMGAALPFIFLWVAIEKGFEGQSYRALACLGLALLSFVVAVYWYRIIPARLQDEGKELEYLRTEQSFIWVALPFTFSFIAVARFFDGGRSASMRPSDS